MKEKNLTLVDVKGNTLPPKIKSVAAKRLDDYTAMIYQDDDYEQLRNDLEKEGKKAEDVIPKSSVSGEMRCRLVGIAECDGQCSGGRCVVKFDKPFYYCACEKTEFPPPDPPVPI